MRNALIAAVIAAAGFSSAALAEGLTVGVSWSNFQEERWKTDEAAIKGALEAAGNSYISADAQASEAKQLTDIEALIAQGADALIVLAYNKDAIGPAIEKAALSTCRKMFWAASRADLRRIATPDRPPGSIHPGRYLKIGLI